MAQGPAVAAQHQQLVTGPPGSQLIPAKQRWLALAHLRLPPPFFLPPLLPLPLLAWCCCCSSASESVSPTTSATTATAAPPSAAASAAAGAEPLLLPACRHTPEVGGEGKGRGSKR